MMITGLCGNLGVRTRQINGQTFRTKLVYEELCKRLGETHVRVVDTSYMLTQPLQTLSRLRRAYVACGSLIIMPGRRGLRLFSWFIARWQKRQTKPLHFLVVGGWLPEFLSMNHRILAFCQGIQSLHVQTRSMVSRLESLGCQNVRWLPNFRAFERKVRLRDSTAPSDKRSLKLVFYSRVIREKGIQDAMEAVRRVNSVGGRDFARLHIYGPIPGPFRREFARMCKQYPEHSYRGVLPPENPYATMEQYDLMVFPTFYPGEGFPGAVLDSFIAGVPVIASDWRYNSEVIEDHKTGRLFPVRDVDALAARIVETGKDRALLLKMKANALRESERYHTDVVFPELLSNLGLAQSSLEPAPPLEIGA